MSMYAFADYFKEAPQAPWCDYDNLFYLYSSNDGFGYDIGEECDDLRSYGFTFGYFSSFGLFTTLDFYCLTNRNTISENSTRTDELKILLGYNIIDINNSIFYLKAVPGLGLLHFANMGIAFIQNSFHDTFHFADPRPMPTKYDELQTNPLAFLYLDAGESLLSMFNFKTYAQITLNLDYYLDFMLGAWITKDFMQIYYSASYNLNSSQSFPSSARTTYNADNGLWFNSMVMLGNFYIERSVNIFTQTPAGSIGIRLNHKNPENNTGDIRFDYSLGGVFGFISNVEILRVHALSFFPHLSFYSWIQKHEDFDTFQKMMRLHIQSLGIDLTLFNPEDITYVNPFAYIGGGFVYERHVTNDQFRARILEQRLMPIMHLGAGGRLKISDIFNCTDFEYGIEFSWNLRFSYGQESIYSNAKSTGRYGIYVSQK